MVYRNGFRSGPREMVLLALVFAIIWSPGWIGAQEITDDSRMRFIYDSQRRLTGIHGPGTREISLAYTDRGQIGSIEGGPLRQTFEYDRLGFQTSFTDDTGATELRTDAVGRLTSISGPHGHEVTYQYTGGGRLASVAWESNHYLNYQRDLLGNVVRMETPVGAFTINHDYNNRITERRYPNGALSRLEHDRAGRAILIEHAAPGGQLVLRFEYSYDGRGLLDSAVEWTRDAELSIAYTYDARGQLLAAEYSDGRRYSYDYDEFGNRTRAVSPIGQVTAVYDARDRLTYLNDSPVDHDASGNMTTLDGGELTFNAFDELIFDGTRRYRFNALGLRVEKTDGGRTTRFLHLLGNLPYTLAEEGTESPRESRRRF